MARSEIRWNDDELQTAIKRMPKEVHKALVATVRYNAPRIMAAAKTGAPWTDRTGNARNGLIARSRSTPYMEKGGSYAVILAHSVDYGIWLEISRAGTYAIIRPTLLTHGPEVIRMARVLVAGAMRGIG